MIPTQHTEKKVEATQKPEVCMNEKNGNRDAREPKAPDAHSHALEHATSAVFEKLATLVGFFAYMDRRKEHLTHRERLVGLNKCLEVAIQQMGVMIKSEESTDEINSLITFFKKSRIEKTNVLWEIEDDVGSLNIEGIHHGKVAFSLTLHFGEKDKTKNKALEHDLKKSQGKTEEEHEAEKKIKSGPAMFKYGADAIHEGNRVEEGEQPPIFKPKPVWSPINKHNMTMRAQQGPPKP